MLFRLIFSLLPFLLLTDPGENADGDDGTSDDAGDGRDDGATDALGDAGKRALDAEREARKKAERAAADLKKRLDQIEADARKRAEDEAAEQGKWQELAAQREAALTEATTTLTSATEKLETLETYVKADIDAVRKQIAEAAKHHSAAKVLLEFHPGDEADTTALLAWTAKAKAQLPSLTEKPTTPGNGPNPKPVDGAKPNIREALRGIRYT